MVRERVVKEGFLQKDIGKRPKKRQRERERKKMSRYGGEGIEAIEAITR